MHSLSHLLQTPKTEEERQRGAAAAAVAIALLNNSTELSKMATASGGRPSPGSESDEVQENAESLINIDEDNSTLLCQRADARIYPKMHPCRDSNSSPFKHLPRTKLESKELWESSHNQTHDELYADM